MTSQQGPTPRDEPNPAEAAVSQEPTPTNTVARATADQTAIPADDPTQDRENHPVKSPGFQGNFGPTPPGPIMHAP